MPENVKPPRDWYDLLTAGLSVMQTAAVVCGVIFAIYEFRGHEERDRKARIDESRKIWDPIQTATESSVRASARTLKSQAAQDRDELKLQRWVSALQPHTGSSFPNFPVELRIKEAPDRKALLDAASKAVSAFIENTSEYRKAITNYVDCVESKSCELQTTKICGSMVDYMWDVRSYFSTVNTATEYRYFVPEGFQSFQDFLNSNRSPFKLAEGVGWGGYSTSTYLPDLESQPPFDGLLDFVAQYHRVCGGGWEPRWLFAGTAGFGE